MTKEEYLRGCFEPDVDYVDGRIEDRNVGEICHGRWQDALLAWFRSNQKAWNLRALPEVRVQVTSENYRVPDVTVVTTDKLNGTMVTEPPAAVIEVISPEDRYPRIFRKLRDYEAMGVKNIFVIDPQNESFSVFSKGRLREAEPIEFIALDDQTECFIDWQEIQKLF